VMQARTTRGLLFFAAGALLVAVWALYFLRLHETVLAPLAYIGWASLISGLLLIGLAMRTLRAQGRSQPGQDFTHTTRVVKHGMYAAVRHPLYLGWAMMYVAGMFFAQHWLIVVLGALGIACLYLVSMQEDEELVARFGTTYEEYARSVPRMNLAVGIARLLRKRRPG